MCKKHSKRKGRSLDPRQRRDLQSKGGGTTKGLTARYGGKALRAKGQKKKKKSGGLSTVRQMCFWRRRDVGIGTTCSVVTKRLPQSGLNQCLTNACSLILRGGSTKKGVEKVRLLTGKQKVSIRMILMEVKK